MSTERLKSVSSVLQETDARLKVGQSAGAKLWFTGFHALDKALSGGFRSGELVLLGGAQGLGKTTFALQVMRNLAATGHNAVYFSFDHDNHSLIERLVSMEAAEIAGAMGVPLKGVREASRRGTVVNRPLRDVWPIPRAALRPWRHCGSLASACTCTVPSLRTPTSWRCGRSS